MRGGSCGCEGVAGQTSGELRFECDLNSTSDSGGGEVSFSSRASSPPGYLLALANGLGPRFMWCVLSGAYSNSALPSTL